MDVMVIYVHTIVASKYHTLLYWKDRRSRIAKRRSTAASLTDRAVSETYRLILVVKPLEFHDFVDCQARI